ncbi:MAG: DMT family transporter [Litoreibacter sp.]
MSSSENFKAQSANRPLAGVFWMFMTGVMFVCVTVIVKTVGDSLPAAQAAFMRYVLGLVFLIPMIKPIRDAQLSRRAVKLFVIRGVVHSGGVMLWFFAMTRISIAEVTAMNYLAPVYVTIGAALFLGEKLASRRIAAIAFAIVGAGIILRPGFRELSSGHFAMLFTAILFAGSYLVAKIMSGEVKPVVVVGMLSITVTIGLAPMAYFVWVPPTLEQVGWMFLLACFATLGHYTMTLAFAAAPVTVTQPVTFLQLVWAVLVGAIFFGEGIDGWVILGGVFILSSVLFITWREHVLKKQARISATSSAKI